jgi:hypothetical protein
MRVSTPWPAPDEYSQTDSLEPDIITLINQTTGVEEDFEMYDD